MSASTTGGLRPVCGYLPPWHHGACNKIARSNLDYSAGFAAGQREGFRRGQEQMRSVAIKVTEGHASGWDDIRDGIRVLPIEELPE